jgi:putative ABC transport system permease protein
LHLDFLWTWPELIVSSELKTQRHVLLANYFKTALRSFLRQKTYTLVNIIGLMVGLTCSFLILMWVSYELSVNRFHENGNRIHKVFLNAHSSTKINTWSSIPIPLAGVLRNDYPEIQEVVLCTYGQSAFLTRPDESTFRQRGRYASSNFFEVFTFPFILGDPETALVSPDAITFSVNLAGRYFGEDWREQDVIGQMVRVDHRKEFVLTGIYEDSPRHSDIRPLYVASVEDFRARSPHLEKWGNMGLMMYIMLSPETSLQELRSRVKSSVNDNSEWETMDVILQPYEDTYLYAKFENGQIVGGRIEYVRLFAIVALFILVIAAINYVNLATARSALRAGEIGIRKVVGAGRWMLIRQFMGESLLVTISAGILACFAIQLLVPTFNQVTLKQLSISFQDWKVVGAFAGMVILTGIAGGLYPALYLSGFSPVNAMKGGAERRSGGGRLRQTLVVFQYAWSILLIVGVLTVYQQIEFIQNRDIGLDRSNVIHTRMNGDLVKRYQVLKQELLALPVFQTVTRLNQSPIRIGGTTQGVTWPGRDPESRYSIRVLKADTDLLKTTGIALVAGRSFSPYNPDSEERSFIINEQLAGIIGYEDPVGRHIEMWGQTGRIVGVVEDFHLSSIHQEVSPLIIRLDPDPARQVFARYAAGKEREAVDALEAIHDKLNPDYPFSHGFLTDDFDRMYRNEAVLRDLAVAFAVLAALISSLGLYGLASFTALQRTKEIGIRKTLGATVSGLVFLLSREFVKLVAIAFIIALPIARYLLGGWLEQFAFRIQLSWTLFALAGLLALIIAWLTVSTQAIRVALSNPLDALRYE